MNPQQAVDLVIEFEDEINNGGFHQFFNNSTGDNTAETIEALNAIGASAFAEILRRAASTFPDNMPSKDRNERRTILWKSFPAGNEFWKLDREFFKYPQDLAALIQQYKLRFPESFSS